ncbi:MAG: virion core protein, T7 gp14 family [Saezia sp.]
MGFSAGTLATMSLGSQVAGGVMSTVGAYGEAKSQKSALKYQAGIADINAQMSENSAQTELIKGNSEIARLTLQHGQHKGSQRAALAANGADMDYGSAVELQYSSEILKDIDMDTLKSNAARSAWGYRTEAMNYKNQALMARASASSISPGMAGFSSLLSSAGSVAGSWSKFKQAGVFDTPTKSLSKSTKSLTKGKTSSKY